MHNSQITNPHAFAVLHSQEAYPTDDSSIDESFDELLEDEVGTVMAEPQILNISDIGDEAVVAKALGYYIVNNTRNREHHSYINLIQAVFTPDEIELSVDVEQKFVNAMILRATHLPTGHYAYIRLRNCTGINHAINKMKINVQYYLVQYSPELFRTIDLMIAPFTEVAYRINTSPYGLKLERQVGNGNLWETVVAFNLFKQKIKVDLDTLSTLDESELNCRNQFFCQDNEVREWRGQLDLLVRYFLNQSFNFHHSRVAKREFNTALHYVAAKHIDEENLLEAHISFYWRTVQDYEIYELVNNLSYPDMKPLGSDKPRGPRIRAPRPAVES